MKRSVFLLGALGSCLSGLALSHDFWIEPSTFRPGEGETVTATLRVGQKVQGERLPRIPSLIDSFLLKGEGVERPVVGRPGADPAGSARVAGAGPYWIGYQSHPYPVTLEAQKFEDYLREEGLERIVQERARRGRSTTDGRERFYRCAKALLETTGEGSSLRASTLDTPLGFTLELVPHRNPNLPGFAGDLPLTLLFRGKPLSSVLVVAMSKVDPGRAVHDRTDRKGSVTLRLSHPGIWLVKAVHMEPASPETGVDWESWWASLTFDVPDRARR
jgi:uncharacterized GH25 family protein